MGGGRRRGGAPGPPGCGARTASPTLGPGKPRKHAGHGAARALRAGKPGKHPDTPVARGEDRHVAVAARDVGRS